MQHTLNGLFARLAAFFHAFWMVVTFQEGPMGIDTTWVPPPPTTPPPPSRKLALDIVVEPNMPCLPRPNEDLLAKIKNGALMGGLTISGASPAPLAKVEAPVAVPEPVRDSVIASRTIIVVTDHDNVRGRPSTERRASAETLVGLAPVVIPTGVTDASSRARKG